MGKMVIFQKVTLSSHIHPKMLEKVGIFKICQFSLNSGEVFKVVLKGKYGNFCNFLML
jgi:hypothetical protein